MTALGRVLLLAVVALALVPAGASAVGGADVNLITGDSPARSQNGGVVWAEGRTVVVGYTDGRDTGNSIGVSVSTDGGLTFARLTPNPFTGHGNTFGEPATVYNRKLRLWFLVAGTAGCAGANGEGLGTWTSANATTWVAGPCVRMAAANAFDDLPTLWVDNNASSPFYGRLYVAWTSLPGGANSPLLVSRSDDGSAWSSPVTVNDGTTFRRADRITGTPGSDGAVVIAADTEPAGSRDQVVYRSPDGGTTWNIATVKTGIPLAGSSGAPCGATFNHIDTTWRVTGNGDVAYGPANVVHDVYDGHGAAADAGDVFYARSTDGGATWGAPIVIATDITGATQWSPTVAATDGGKVVVTWYDRRNSSGSTSYERRARVSSDNGATWGADETLSDVLIPQWAAPTDFGVCFQGPDHAFALGNVAYFAWLDGRVGSQQDVFFDRADFNPPGGGSGGGGGGGGTGGGGGGAGAAPRVSRLKLSPTAFAAARSGPSATAARTGTKVTFQLSALATVTFTVERPAAGRRKGRKCTRPTSRNRRARRCTRYVRVKGSFKRNGAVGANSFRFTGRMSGRKLRRGRYRLVSVAKVGTAKSKATRARFRITG